jgi:hypothetical protein
MDLAFSPYCDTDIRTTEHWELGGVNLQLCVGRTAI